RVAGAHRGDAEPRREDPVRGRRHAAVLEVTEDGGAPLEPGRGADLLADALGGARAGRALAMLVLARLDPALRDDDDRVVAALAPTFFDLLDDLLHAVRELGDEDHVGAASEPRRERDPAGAPAAHLEEHDAVVALAGRLQLVDRLGRGRDRGVP